MAILKGPSFGPLAGGAPRRLVVMCHGLGASGQDLIALAPTLAKALPHTVFLAPDAPEPCDMVPPEHGEFSRQWFSLQDWRLSVMEEGARVAHGTLDRFLDEALAKYGIPPTDYAIAGFSQGAMMALFTGLRRKTPPRTILSYAGILLGPEQLGAEIANRAPVLLVHGEKDEVVPADASRIAAGVLTKLSVPVELMLRAELGHAIDAEAVEAGMRVLAQAFAGA